jgi:hypothetical protein
MSYLLSQNSSEQCARRQKQSGKFAAPGEIGDRAKGPWLLAFLADQCRARGYREPGVPTKKRGCPTIEKMNLMYSTMIRGVGVKKFLQFYIFYD